VGPGREATRRDLRDQREKVQAAAGHRGQAAEQLVRLGQGGRMRERAGEVTGGLLRLVPRQSGSCLLKRAIGGAACIHEREQ
jgi:hypothetical protein